MKIFVIFVILFLLVAVQAQKPEFVLQTGHSGTVSKIAFSSDGKLLASGDAGGLVKFWDLSSNREIRSVRTRIGVESLAFSRDGKFLYVASRDRSVSRFEVSNGQRFSVIESSKVSEFSSTKAVINSAKSIVAQITDDGSLRVSSLIDQKEIFKFVLPSDKDLDFDTAFFRIAFGAKGNVLIGAGSEKIALIDAANGKLQNLVKASNPSCPAVSDDEKSFAVCEKTETSDGETDKSFVTIRSALTGAVLKKIDVQIGEAISLSFAPDGKVLSGIVKVKNKEEALEFFKINYWNPATGKEIRTSEFEQYVSSFWTFESLKFSPDGKTLALGAGDGSKGRIYMRDFESGKDIAQLKKHSENIYDARFLKDNFLFAEHRILDLKTGRQIANFFGEQAISSDGKKIAKGSPGAGFEILETKGGKSLAKLNFKRLSTTDYSIKFSPKDKYAVTFCRRGWVADAKDFVRLFDAATGELLFAFPDNSKLMSFSADEKFLAYSTPVDEKKGRFAVKIWNVEAKKQISQIAVNAPVSSFSAYFQSYDFYPVTALSFNAEGDFLAVGGLSIIGTKEAGFLDLYASADGKLQRQFGDAGLIYSMEFSGDGAILAATSGDKIALLGVKSKNDKRILAGHESSVNSISFHEGGKILASGGSDGQIIFWDFKTGAIISRLIMTGETDFILISPDNFYLASRKGGASSAAFRQGARAFPFEQFDIRFNRPDLALKSLGFASAETLELYAKAFHRRLRQNNLTEADLQDELKLPTVSVETASIPSVTKEKILRFKIKADDEAYPLKRLNVYVNDAPLYGAKGFSLSDLKSRNLTKDVELELTSGNNRVQISAVNDKGIESFRQTFNVKYEGASPPPELYLVAVGVSKYKDESYNLTYPAQDVANIVKIFETRAAEKEIVWELSVGQKEKPKSFYRLHKLELTNENAVLEKLETVRDFLKAAKPEDEIVIFFSGHGLLDAGQNYFFATHDVDFKNPSKRGLSFEALENLVDAGRARRKMLLIDSCHAGEIDKTTAENLKITAPTGDGTVKSRDVAARSDVYRLDEADSQTTDAADELFADLRLGSGAVVISASGGLEYAFESRRWSGGVFTYAVRLGLENFRADANRDYEVTISELREFVGKKVTELTEGRQKPNARRDTIEYDFRVY